MTVPLESLGSKIPADEPDGVRVTGRQVAAFLGAYLGAYLILIVPVASTLAIKVAEVAPESRETALGIVSGVGALVALLANPIIGALSDRTTSRFGMRRPWVLAGAVAGVAALMVLAFSPSVLVIGVAWAAVQLSMNAVLAGLAAFLPDHVPPAQRAKVSALAGIAQQVSPLLGLVVANAALGLGGGTAGMFVAPASLGLALIMIYVLVLEDRVLPADLRRPFRWSTIFLAFAFNPRRNPDFGWAWLGRFFLCLAFAANTTYQVYLLNDRLGIPLEQVTTTLIWFTLLGTVLMSVSATVSGGLSDRLRRRKPFVFVASGLVAASSLVTAFSHTLPMLAVAVAITGIATGTYFAVDLALVTDVLPDPATAAKDMGIINIANALPQSVAPALAPFLLAVGGGGNYTALYVGGAVVAGVGALTVIPIKSVR